MLVKYVGVHADQHVRDQGRWLHLVRDGDPVEMSDETAGALTAQHPHLWTIVQPPAAKPASKKEKSDGE